MQQQANFHMQKQNFEQMKDLLLYCKQEIKRNQQKLLYYQKQINQYKKQQQKIAQLQKLNQQHSVRLLQSMSNIRELLHSNKTLREELNHEIYLKQIQTKKTEKLQYKLSKLTQQLKKRPFPNQDEEAPLVAGYLKSNKQINIHKLAKFQRLSKQSGVINPVRYYRHSLGNIQSQFHSPTSQNTKMKLKLLNDRHRNNTQFEHREVSNPQIQRVNSISRSLSSKEEKKYLKAQLKRKKSIYDSDKRMQMLQHKPFPVGLNLS